MFNKRQWASYDQGSKDLRPMKAGDQIGIQSNDTDKWGNGRVIQDRCLQHQDAKHIKFPNGTYTSRNRRKIRFKHGSAKMLQRHEPSKRSCLSSGEEDLPIPKREG